LLNNVALSYIDRHKHIARSCCGKSRPLFTAQYNFWSSGRRNGIIRVACRTGNVASEDNSPGSRQWRVIEDSKRERVEIEFVREANLFRTATKVGLAARIFVAKREHPSESEINLIYFSSQGSYVRSPDRELAQLECIAVQWRKQQNHFASVFSFNQ